MKCTVVEQNTKTDEIDLIKFSTIKEAKKYIEQRKDSLSNYDNQHYEFGINKGWNEDEEDN